MDEEERRRRRRENALGALAAASSVDTSVRRLAEVYRKPLEYTGNRKLFDDGMAKRLAKENLFASGRTVKDPYTGEKLFLRKQEAKLAFGKKWTEHLAEADHVEPVHRIFEAHKDDAWATSGDIKDAVNSPENLKTISRKLNNAKRDRTNEDFYGNDKYLSDKDIHLSQEAKERAMEDGRQARDYVDRSLALKGAGNLAAEFHRAGVEAAAGAAVFSGAMAAVDNMVAVIEGKKEPGKAIKDLVKVTGTSAALSYAAGGAVSVISHSLSASSNSLARMLGQAGVPGKVVAAVLSTAGIIKNYIYGKITAPECIAQLGETGIATSTAAAGMYVGAVVIPLPVIGSLIGGMVGYMLSGRVFTALSGALASAKLARNERIRIERECGESIRRIQGYRRQLDEIMEKYFKENRKVFDEALGDMVWGLKLGDADGYIHGAGKIIQQLGGKVSFRNMDEFDELMKSDDIIKL
jgi:hypothetical protein|nr:hypothetical protein [uncultured Dialister sp.]